MRMRTRPRTHAVWRLSERVGTEKKGVTLAAFYARKFPGCLFNRLRSAGAQRGVRIEVPCGVHALGVAPELVEQGLGFLAPCPCKASQSSEIGGR